MTEPMMRVLDQATTYTAPDSTSPTHWIEHLRVEHLSVGTLSIPAGGSDDQQPHAEDEVYAVTAGRATLEVGGQQVAVSAGSVVFVKAEAPHHFLDIEEDLTALVFFAPPYSGRG